MTKVEEPRPPSMDDKSTPSPPGRQTWQYDADKLMGVNGRPWPTDAERRAALAAHARGEQVTPTVKLEPETEPFPPVVGQGDGP